MFAHSYSQIAIVLIMPAFEINALHRRYATSPGGHRRTGVRLTSQNTQYSPETGTVSSLLITCINFHPIRVERASPNALVASQLKTTQVGWLVTSPLWSGEWLQDFFECGYPRIIFVVHALSTTCAVVLAERGPG